MKQYNNEPTIISLTSWTERINTVGLTLFSLLRQCPQSHIILVLSEAEFPTKMNALPSDIRQLTDKNLIEIYWVYENTKSFKKVIPNMRRFSSVPIISADDDCIYVCNYAKTLYEAHIKHPTMPINFRKSSFAYCTCGPATLYPPTLYNYIINEYDKLPPSGCQDDGFFADIFRKANVQPLHITDKFPCFFHDEKRPITGSYNVAAWRRDQSF